MTDPHEALKECKKTDLPCSLREKNERENDRWVRATLNQERDARLGCVGMGRVVERKPRKYRSSDFSARYNFFLLIYFII